MLVRFEPDKFANQLPDCNVNLADANGDGNVDPFDIGPFLGLLFP